ncbi:MAG: hypothetical protein J2P28_00460 [Actinobacteria bacterium]|nr:hypothetical protein [Actinomycetota bacterium]MBO0830749.1 hypothetical protein [Actinomycetota bacterium]MBO0833972.1 hypothetical protein [Actinomycetota bacterium]
MTLRRWLVAGWILMAATAGCAVAGAVLALDAVGGPFVIYGATANEPFKFLLDPVKFLLGIILAVLAGVWFFGGLACFFWGAIADSRQQMGQILQGLRGGD